MTDTPQKVSSSPPHYATGVSVRPAATLIIFRHAPTGGSAQLLMVQRSREMRFAGGAAVFPGGRVDSSDRDLAARLLPDDEPDVSAARIAAIRETIEETGLVTGIHEDVSAAQALEARALVEKTGTLASALDRFGWTLAPERLACFAHWCPLVDNAFDTRFFITDLGTGAVDIAVDLTENTRLFWVTAAEAIAMDKRGEISVIFPTMRNLERLAQFTNHAEVMAHIGQYPARPIHPQRIQRDGETWLSIPEGIGYPVTSQSLRTAKRGNGPFKQ